jgi:hypothetical protein
MEYDENIKNITSKYSNLKSIIIPRSNLNKVYNYNKDLIKVLDNYEPGRPENKPKLMEQIKKMEDERAKRIEDHNRMLQSQQKLLSNSNKPLNKDLINEYEKKLDDKNYLINELLKKIKFLTTELESYKERDKNK